MQAESRRRYRIAPALVIVLGGMGMLAGQQALAQVDTSDWKCEYCPFPEGYEADVEVGATSVSDDAARFGNATGYDESGVYANVDGDGLYSTDGYRFAWMAEDLGLDSRKLDIEGGKPGTFGFRFGYSELPYRLFDSTRTVFTPVFNDTLELPSDWVTASRTQNMPGLAAALRPLNIGSDRQTFSAGVDIEAVSSYTFYADYRRLQRDGVQIMGGSSFFQAALLPRTIDSTTDSVDAGVRYASGPLSLAVAWFGSVYMSKPVGLTWDNPFGVFTDRGRAALEPDNSFQQFSVSGNYKAESLKSIIAFTAAKGRGEQDDYLLPYTINPSIPAPGLPRSTLGGKVDTSNYALTVTSKPLPKARIKLAYRYDERDNSTPQAMWSRVVVDGFLATDSDMNIPYSFERGKLSVSGAYRLFDTVRLSGGYTRTTLDRTFQEVAEQTTDEGYGRLRWRPAPALELDVKGGTSRRDIDRYDDTLAATFDQNPLLRKYNLAYRYREFAEVTLAFTPAELPYSAALHARYADDDYARSRLGLLSGEESHLALDIGWAVSDRTSVYINASEEEIESNQAGSSLFGAPNWTATNDDDFMTLGAGLRIRNIGDKVDLQLDYVTSDGESEITLDPPSGATSEFPELRSQFDDLRLTLSYRSSTTLSWNLNLRYQTFKTTDWALQGVTPSAVPSLLSLGAMPYDEDVFAVGIGIRYGIGDSGSE